MSDINAELTNFETELTVNFTNSVNQTWFDFVADHVSSVLNVYYIPCLVVLGTIGNLLSVFVFQKSKLRLQSISQYLSALAISDTLFLFQLLPPWLSAMQLNNLFHRQGFCQVFVYISYVTCCLSAWLVVAFTVERFVAIIYPLQRNVICTTNRARLIIYIIAGIAILLNMPVLRFAIATKNECSINYEYLEYAEKFNLADTFVSFTVPSVVIIVLNTSITVAVFRLERARHQLMKTEQLQMIRKMTSTKINAYPGSQQKVTRMLLTVSSVFVILNMPAYTIRLIVYAYDMGTEEQTGRWADVQQVAVVFFNTNFGINFILYCLSGQNFRRALAETIPCL